ncbi:hypothetical protein [Hyphobacterium sp.]|uniref:hypothetical protein n=1 Tax=Hyphobacterium sp. TaxID=2004662 RepID=UPI003B52CCA6
MKRPIHQKTAEQRKIDRQWDLFGEKHPEYCVAGFQKYRPEGLFLAAEGESTDENREAEARAYHDEIVALDDVQLETRWTELQGLKAAQREAAHPLNSRIATDAVYDHFAKAAYWTLDEGVALLLERDPKGLNSEAVKKHRPPPTIGHRFTELRDLARRAAKMQQLAYENLPGFFLAWAKRNRLPIPDELASAIEGHGIQVADWKSIADQRAELIAALEAKIERLEASSPSQPSQATDDGLGARERSTLLKIVLGMAIANYKHDPYATRTTTASAMLQDFDTLGIAVSDDTIRKYLREAAEYAPPPETE